MRLCSRLFLLYLCLAGSLSLIAAAQSPGRQISGQVQVDAKPAPAGVFVILQIVGGKYVTPADEPEIARAYTDKNGNFVFEHLEELGRNNGREFFAVTVRAAGYTAATQVVDLTLVSSAEITLDLRREELGKSESYSSSSQLSAATRRSRSPEAEQHLDLGRELLFRKHDPEAAIGELKQAVKADPWFGPGYILLGLANMQLERWSDAQVAFSEAGKVEPGNAQAYLGQGSAFNEQHDYVSARKALEQSLKLNPDSAEAHYELARTLVSQEKWDAAQPHAQRALELNPDYPGPHALMADIYLEQQDLASARHEYQEYLRLDPEGNLAAAAKQTIAEIDKVLAQGSRRH